MQRNPDYRPSAESAKRNLSRQDFGSSVDSVTFTLEDALVNYAELSTMVSKEMYRKTLEHLAKFMRIVINLKFKSNDSNDLTSVTFTVLIERHKNVEELARHIEAEYAFMHMRDSITSSTIDRDTLINCLHVITIYDVGNVSLKFASRVDELLDSGDEVFVVGVLMENINMKTLIGRKVLRMKEFLDAQSGLSLRGSSLETQTLSLLHNLTGIQEFQEFCMNDFEIESLLFWLEVEVFRGLCWLANGYDFSSGQVEATNPEFSHLLLHARYIYMTFMADYSSLRVNLPTDIASTTDWPLPAFDPVSGVNLPIRISMWDEIQEHIFQYLAFFVYPKFMLDASCDEWNIILQSSVDFESEEDGWISPGFHFQNFQQDVDGMEKAVIEAISADPSNDVSRDMDNRSISMSSRVRSRRASSAGSRRVLSVSEGGAAASSAAGESQAGGRILPPDYYGHGPKITNAQKQRRIQREKKLRKFFGDVPSRRDDFSEAKLQQFAATSKNDDREVDIGEIANSAQPNSSETDEATVKRRKAGKLEEFFGVNKIPAEQLFEQQLISKLEQLPVLRESASDLYIGETQNELDPEIKKRILQRKKKITGIMGDASAVNAATLRQPRDKEMTDSEVVTLDGGKTDRSIRSGISAASGMAAGESLVSKQASVRQDRDEKEYKRKKLDKIHQFLGEKVSSQIVVESMGRLEVEPATGLVRRPAIMTAKDKQTYLRRMHKLQQMFGDVPPSNAISSKTPSSKRSAPASSSASPNASSSGTGAKVPRELVDILGGERAFKFLLSNEEALRQLMKMLDDFDREEQMSYIAEEDEGDQEVSEQVAKLVGQARQRRRIGKLTRFFGSTAGRLSAEVSTEERVLEDLGNHLLPLIDPALLKFLQAKVMSSSSLDEELDEFDQGSGEFPSENDM